MKHLFNIFCISLALITGLGACQKTESGPLDSVDLRYRVNDSYNLSARSASSITIVVTSTEPWYIVSEHPDWCIIETEEGEASNADDVRVGKGNKTSVKVQYYDNLQLDDRTDVLTIGSGDWIGKKVTVNQKGIAYLDIPEEDLTPSVIKDGGNITINIESNQDWSAQVTEGDWLTITEGEKGENDGTITFSATKNSAWQRYATVVIYDRRGVAMHTIAFTQDGVQIDPESMEIRAAYDQSKTSLKVVSNSKWKAVKASESEDWYTIENPENEGEATINITLKENPGTGLRKANILIQSVSDNPDDFVAERSIVLKQAYYIAPVRKVLDNNEMGLWKSDKTNTPVYTKDVGTLFKSEARLNNSSMPFGNYTFRWSAIDPAARIRHWFCYSDSQELKFNLRKSTEVNLDFNASGMQISGKPADADAPYSTTIQAAEAHEMTIKFEPSGEKYCRVIYLVDGVQIGAFESSDSVMHMVTYGSNINMYFGVDTGGSAICEWYEYTAPVDWNE